MKHFTLLVVLFIFSTGLALAATPVPTPAQNTASKNINVRMMDLIQKIKQDQHSGKITKDQAKAYRDQVKAVRKQQLDDMKANGRKQLTDAQTAQINQSLDTIASSL